MMISMSEQTDLCITCYGTGEVVTEQGGVACPDCYGEGRIGARDTNIEWRLRALERRYTVGENETAQDVQWLLHELRGCREALVRILTLCHDADPGEGPLHEVKYAANQALGIYDPETK
jgi:hypothetical protein